MKYHRRTDEKPRACLVSRPKYSRFQLGARLMIYKASIEVQHSEERCWLDYDMRIRKIINIGLEAMPSRPDINGAVAS